MARLVRFVVRKNFDVYGTRPRLLCVHEHQPWGCPMTYLDLAPAIAAIRSRPEEFEISHDSLYHRRSRHRFNFLGEDDVRIEAACDCSLLRASSEQARAFHAAYRAWHASYWRPMAINREFASHFAPP